VPWRPAPVPRRLAPALRRLAPALRRLAPALRRVVALPWRVVALLAAAAVVLTACASARAAPQQATDTAMRTTIHAIRAGGRTRTWVQITPLVTQARSVPIIVVLSGISATTGAEIARDGLLDLVATGRAELVYPNAIGKSWNAGGCCGTAQKEHVNDLAFLQALVPKVDPGHRRPLYLAGYSNGGRLAYQVACTDPSLIDGIAVVKAMPDAGCVVSRPVSVLQIDSTNDYAVPYQPGDHGKEHPPATVEVADLHSVDHCAAPAAVASHGSLKLTTWRGCAHGTRLSFAVYTGGKHSWPLGGRGTPSAATLIWGFASGSG
jgi:polyhydroxybutyrate depolymerase